jgi:hypothetical protein
MSGKIKNELELTDEEIARATSLLNARFAEERKQNTSLLDRGMFGTQNDVNRRAYEAASMSYDDFLQGDTYEDLAKRYSEKGKMAMDDTIGKVAARTGGIASSYATQAGQQAYGDWMTRLEETARAMYDAERQEAMDRYALSKDVLDMRNSAEDRRLALEDRLRKQSQEDEAKQEADYTELQDEIYEAAYNGNVSWPQFASRANALGLDKDTFLGIVKQGKADRDSAEKYAIDEENAKIFNKNIERFEAYIKGLKGGLKGEVTDAADMAKNVYEYILKNYPNDEEMINAILDIAEKQYGLDVSSYIG